MEGIVDEQEFCFKCFDEEKEHFEKLAKDLVKKYDEL